MQHSRGGCPTNAEPGDGESNQDIEPRPDPANGKDQGGSTGQKKNPEIIR